MKLAGLSFNAIPRMPGMRAGELATIDCAKPGDALLGWRISIRGQQVFFISPPGWSRGDLQKQRPSNGSITVFETSRAEVTFHWTGAADEAEAILKGGKYDSEPMGPPPVLAADKPLLSQVPSSQIGDA